MKKLSGSLSIQQRHLLTKTVTNKQQTSFSDNFRESIQSGEKLCLVRLKEPQN